MRRVGDERLLLRERPPHRHHHLPDEEEPADHRHEDDADADQGDNQAQFVQQGMERLIRSARLDDHGDVRAVLLADPDRRGQDARIASGR